MIPSVKNSGGTIRQTTLEISEVFADFYAALYAARKGQRDGDAGRGLAYIPMSALSRAQVDPGGIIVT